MSCVSRFSLFSVAFFWWMICKPRLVVFIDAFTRVSKTDTESNPKAVGRYFGWVWARAETNRPENGSRVGEPLEKGKTKKRKGSSSRCVAPWTDVNGSVVQDGWALSRSSATPPASARSLHWSLLFVRFSKMHQYLLYLCGWFDFVLIFKILRNFHPYCNSDSI